MRFCRSVSPPHPRAQAGIQATLNARASIIAAANPLYGRYDRSKTLRQNVQLGAPIMSRFDLFFVVLDECDSNFDERMAAHIVRNHQGRETVVKTPFTKEQVQRYVRFARSLSPKITEPAQQVMVECYRRLRQGNS